MRIAMGTMMNRWTIAVLGMSLAAMVLPVRAGALTLAHEGKPTATLVLATNATRAAQFAAYELQYHIQKITGAVLPIVKDGTPVAGARILVGESPATQALGINAGDFKPQEYLIQFAPQAIVLMGRDQADFTAVKYDLGDPGCLSTWPGFWDERSTTYAVYDFLTKFCGVRWFNPTDTGTVIPHKPTLAVSGRNLRRQPAFEYRDILGSGHDSVGFYDPYVQLWTDPQSAGYKAWEQAAYADLHAQGADANALTGAKSMRQLLFLLRMKNGGTICRCSHSFYGYTHRFWKKSDTPDLAKLFEGKHPEFFAQGYEGDPPQLCYSGTGTIRQVAKDAVEYLKGQKTGGELGIEWNPQRPNPFPMEPMDNGFFCKCPECQRLIALGKDYGPSNVFSVATYSDYFFNFVNEVAKETRKTLPDAQLVTLAYMTHAWPAKSVDLDPSVALQFCFSANRLPYSREEYDNEISALNAWAARKNPLYVWLYDCFPVYPAENGKFHCFPAFTAHTKSDQFKRFHRLGVRGMFYCWMFGPETDAYVNLRLMDDPTLDIDDLLTDYFSQLYGPAGKPLQQLYLEIEKVYTDPANYRSLKKPLHQSAEIAWTLLGTTKRMAAFGKLMDKAKRMAVTAQEKRNVELFDLGVWKYMTEGQAKYWERANAPTPSLTVPAVTNALGDPTKVPWEQAAALTGGWFVYGGKQPAERRLTGRMAHDGQFLYVELVDPCDTTKLMVSPMVYPCDDWEIFAATQLGKSYRQIVVGPDSRTAFLQDRANVSPEAAQSLRAVSDKTSPDRWVTRLAIPLKELVPGGAQAGDKIYLNVLRASSPALKGSIDTWVSYTTVHEVDRLAAVVLAKP